MKKYKEEDISVVIPTCNRAEDLKKTLKPILTAGKKIKEILIVDQSRDNKTKKAIEKLKYTKIKYIYSKTPSITIARNLGVKKADKESKIICFLDDDVTLEKDYFNGILEIFNKYPEAKAVAGFVPPEKDMKKENFISNLIKRIFYLQRKTKDEAEIVSAYGNTYPYNLKKIINAEWLQGVNMIYKKEVFDEQKFDENLLGYTIAEDTDFNYRLYKKYPKLIFITPYAKIIHRDSKIERYETRKMAYINQTDHFYFNFKNLNKNFMEKIIFVWALLGIILLRTTRFIFGFKKEDRLKLQFFFESLVYCIKNLDKIKKGDVRSFRLD